VALDAFFQRGDSNSGPFSTVKFPALIIKGTTMLTSSKPSGTLLALTAILIWSMLALISTRLAHISSFLILSIAFLISGLPALFRSNAWKVPFKTILVGIAGIFGYHFLYFRAFALAPAVEANLINYLWPLLIVVLSPVLLSGFYLKPRHFISALLGLAGAALIVTEGHFIVNWQYLPGYLSALGAAIIWAVYSLLTKRLPSFGTETVSVFCLISGICSLIFFLLSGGRMAEILSLHLSDWILLILAGIGPLGTAFYCWDAALKRGDPRVIGALAYLTPLLSTLNLILFAGKGITLTSIAAMILIIGGAVLGSR
jgi:drug/metabolite transporter (DMT)-like permease